MSCPPAFTNLSWPYCQPNAAKNIYECAPSFSGNCCLSQQTSNKSTSNCPAGFKSNPAAGEWCTDSWWGRQYRHKCQRVDYSSFRFFEPIYPNVSTNTLTFSWASDPYPVNLLTDNVSFQLFAPQNPNIGVMQATPANSQYDSDTKKWKTTLNVNLVPPRFYGAGSIIYTLSLLVDGNTVKTVSNILVQINSNNNNINPDYYY